MDNPPLVVKSKKFMDFLEAVNYEYSNFSLTAKVQKFIEALEHSSSIGNLDTELSKLGITIDDIKYAYQYGYTYSEVQEGDLYHDTTNDKYYLVLSDSTKASIISPSDMESLIESDTDNKLVKLTADDVDSGNGRLVKGKY